MKKIIITIWGISSLTLSFSQIDCFFELGSLKIQNDAIVDSFITGIEEEDFFSTNDKSFIPQFILNEIQCIIGTEFSIANPDEPFNDSCFHQDTLPDRQIDFLGISPNYLLLTYTTGGAGLTSHILLIKYNSNKQIQKLWKGFSWIFLKNKKTALEYLGESRKRKYDLKYYDHW